MNMCWCAVLGPPEESNDLALHINVTQHFSSITRREQQIELHHSICHKLQSFRLHWSVQFSALAISIHGFQFFVHAGVTVPSAVERKELQQFPVVKEVSSWSQVGLPQSCVDNICLYLTFTLLYTSICISSTESILPPVSATWSCTTAAPRGGDLRPTTEWSHSLPGAG